MGTKFWPLNWYILIVLILIVSLINFVFEVLTLGDDIIAKPGGSVTIQCKYEAGKWFNPDDKEAKNDGIKYKIDAANNTLTILKIGMCFSLGCYF